MFTDCPPGPEEQKVSTRRSFWIDLDVDFFGLGQDGNGDGRGMNTAARFGLRHALNAMNARFVTQLGIDIVALDHGDGVLNAARHRYRSVSRISIFQPCRSA